MNCQYPFQNGYNFNWLHSEGGTAANDLMNVVRWMVVAHVENGWNCSESYDKRLMYNIYVWI